MLYILLARRDFSTRCVCNNIIMYALVTFVRLASNFSFVELNTSRISQLGVNLVNYVTLFSLPKSSLNVSTVSYLSRQKRIPRSRVRLLNILTLHIKSFTGELTVLELTVQYLFSVFIDLKSCLIVDVLHLVDGCLASH